MQVSRRLVTLGVLLVSLGASADPYDLSLARLGSPDAASPSYAPDANARFREFALQLGAALNSVSLVPPGSLGHSGFAVALELGVAAIQDTKIAVPTVGAFHTPLLMPSVHVRKGLPFSLELGGKVTWIERSRMMAGTLEVRWAFLEGFVHLPDVAVRGHVTRLVNGRELNLTQGGVDLTIGKRFPVAGSVNFIPYGGWNVAWVGASSSTVDFDPNRDPNASFTSPAAQLADTAVFTPVSASNSTMHRFYVGLRFGAGAFRLGAEVSLTAFGSHAVPDPANPTVTISRGIPILAAFGSTIGLSF